ncbi:hypothetical protein HYH02_008866 [Chlamydomonas schloesseri]|uniref:Uncharacterized protein n=1 Tax=Chlamydomonas schloesseri TaxID=2026947 RepID=A0A836B1M1_9CHLO|nr:hypothetical protein HYH02_008866 [Chlamydomonas schloesseri]|eukprot:KAG2444996.1 hypothetical protein HYH02_008866 [Chlamydomonas schloesseri]
MSHELKAAGGRQYKKTRTVKCGLAKVTKAASSDAGPSSSSTAPRSSSFPRLALLIAVIIAAGSAAGAACGLTVCFAGGQVRANLGVKSGDKLSSQHRDLPMEVRSAVGAD